MITFCCSTLSWLSEILFHAKSKKKPSAKPRTIYCTQTSNYRNVKEELMKQEYMFRDNTIRNTKYSFLSFIPKALMEQFSLHMNQYFLLLAVMQLWKTITPVNPISTWTPLLVVVGVGMLKEFVDDFFRFRKDREANEKHVCILRDGGRRTIAKSREVHVGDLVLVKEDECVCADMVVLRSSDDDTGLCYIETSALDGEEDYKERRVPKQIAKLSLDEIYTFSGMIDAPAPNPEIGKFDSTLTLGNEIISLSEKNLLLQGTFLKSTEQVIGMVVYTGNESKIGMNKQSVKIKWTKADTFLNNAVIFVFLIQFLCGVILGTTGNILRERIERSFYFGYAPDYTPSVPSYIIIPLRFMLLCSLMIPQSLKVTSDLCKYILSVLISYDIGLYDEKTNTAAGAANTSICEDLGQIQYLFTDKTGTLTENVMIFRKCVINGETYNAESGELRSKLREGEEKVTRFMETITLCNTVFSSMNEKGEAHYRSHSPDEAALVNFARDVGFVLLHRDHDRIKIEQFGRVREFKILNVLEFDSNRRRMSVIIQPTDSGNGDSITILTKGGDDAIFTQLRKDSKLESYKNSVKRLANDGLRIMCMACKQISQNEYDQWKVGYEDACNSLNDRDQKVAAAYSAIEQNLQYIGCSGIEDSLQESVPETIQALRDAGIVVWMLTGDKKETAIMIGYSCSLIDRDVLGITSGTHLFDIEGGSVEEVSTSLENALLEIENMESLNRAVVIDGNSLKFIFPNDIPGEDKQYLDPKARHNKRKNMKMLADLTIQCKSVICCRMSPIQKGKIVKMMKGSGSKRKRCLAIGDGGNDVTMILESDVGVGISGKEGLQAVRASDFSIARFKYLKRLLLVHGRNSSRRMALVAQYTMYKSLILALCQLLFAFFSAFSGAPLLNTYSLTMYNLIFTAIMPISFAFDKDVSDEALERIPELYSESRENRFINTKTFITWFLFATFQACVIVLGVMGIMNGNYMIGGTGRTMDYWTEGIVVLTVVLTIQLVDHILLLRSFTILSVTISFGSYIAFVVTTILYSVIKWLSGHTTMYMAAIHLLSDPGFYIVCLLLSLVASSPLILQQFLRTLPNMPIPLSLFVRFKELSERHKSDGFWSSLRHQVVRLKDKTIRARDLVKDKWTASSILSEEGERVGLLSETING